jgi:hypothetical protein
MARALPDINLPENLPRRDTRFVGLRSEPRGWADLQEGTQFTKRPEASDWDVFPPGTPKPVVRFVAEARPLLEHGAITIRKMPNGGYEAFLFGRHPITLVPQRYLVKTKGHRLF